MNRLRYLVPNSITAAALTCGLIAMWLAMNEAVYEATWWVIYATLLDRMDGGVARALKASSKVGSQFDSFSDFTSFGLAPAFLFMCVVGSDPGLFSALAVLAFVLASALRLARFQASEGSEMYSGVPTTMAGGIFATALNVSFAYDVVPADHIELYAGLLLLFSVLMNVPWMRYERIGKEKSRVFRFLVPSLAVLCIVLIFMRSFMEIVLAITSSGLVMGPVISFIARKKRASEAQGATPVEDNPSTGNESHQ